MTTEINTIPPEAIKPRQFGSRSETGTMAQLRAALERLRLDKIPFETNAARAHIYAAAKQVGIIVSTSRGREGFWNVTRRPD